MAQTDLPAMFMRGGTSNGLVFDIADLPSDTKDWNAIFLASMGSPDPYMRQLDGMGGGLSSLSKVCVVGPATRDDADVDYTFAQIHVDKPIVDYAGNCGNMVSAIGPAALDMGYVQQARDGTAQIRIHNTNTGKIIVSHFPVVNGQAEAEGTLEIDGVAGCAAPVKLDFLNPGGSKTGKLLPSGNPVDMLTCADGRTIRASLIDAANPCVFVDARDVGKTGTESPQELAEDAGFLALMEDIRKQGSVMMGVVPDLKAAGELGSIPKVAMVAPPADYTTLSGRRIPAGDVSLLVRMISMEQPHRAVPITGGICLAIACRVKGSIPAELVTSPEGAITVAHASGTLLVDADVRQTESGPEAESGSVFRTARKMFSGVVHYRILAS